MTDYEDRSRPTAGELEERRHEITTEGRRIRGVVPYGVESRDMGGWSEVIEPGALRAANLDDLIARVDHTGVPIGRFPGTLEVEDTRQGLRWAVTPPESRSDVVEAVQRGDLKAGSWQMIVAKDRWAGDVRHVEQIAELRDVSVVSSPAYPAAAVEYRAAPTTNQEDNMSEESTSEVRTEEERAEDNQDQDEQRSQPTASNSAGSLKVEERTSEPRRGLADEFRSHGFPGEVAEIPWQAYESRAVAWSPSINLLDQVDRQGGPLGFDARYVWTTLPRVGVDAGVTSVQVLAQSSRSLASAASTIRAIDATSNKAETGTTINLTTVPLSGVASIESGIANVVLEQQQVNSLIEGDLALAVNEGIDKLVNDTFAASGFQAPGTDNLVASVRKAMTTVIGAGYAPDTLVMTPASSETLDLLVSGISGGSADYVFQPGQPAPGIWGLRRVISKVIAAPVVLDSQAYGKLYASPARLARFEEASGKTNTSLVRLELHAACGVERQTAAVRIAAS